MKALRTFITVACLAVGPLSLAQGQGDDSVAKGKSADRSVVYRIMATDKLSIRVFQEDELSTLSRVDANGTINLPLVGQIRVYGQTLPEAQKTIEAAYHDGRYLRNPQVTVSVEDYAPREVSIQGQVRSPGRYPLPIESTITLYDLVTKAGGFTDSAKGTAVRVTRIMPDGSARVFTVDVDSLLKGKEKKNTEDSSMLLQPNDIVYVPERVI